MRETRSDGVPYKFQDGGLLLVLNPLNDSICHVDGCRESDIH